MQEKSEQDKLTRTSNRLKSFHYTFKKWKSNDNLLYSLSTGKEVSEIRVNILGCLRIVFVSKSTFIH